MIILKNNPELCNYEIVSGCSKTVKINKLNTNFDSGQSEIARINSILKNNVKTIQEKWKDDYLLNQLLRKRQREAGSTSNALKYSKLSKTKKSIFEGKAYVSGLNY